MAKNSIRDYSATVGENTDIQSVNIDEGCSPAGINNAIREMMVDLANVNSGSVSLVSPDFDAATVNGTAIDAFPSGTKMLFNQTSAPTGWTKDTTHNDKALRITNGTVGTGGSVAFETAFASHTPAGSVGVTIDGTALTEAQLPAHKHIQGVPYASGVSGTGYTPRFSFDADSGINVRASQYGSAALSDDFPFTSTVGSGDTHTHTNSASFVGTAINLDVSYVDVIIASKD